MTGQRNKDTTASTTFRLENVGVRAWIDQDTIHLIAVDGRDPVELTASMARKLAAYLEIMAIKIEE
jgi:hypothetical protein